VAKEAIEIPHSVQGDSLLLHSAGGDLPSEGGPFIIDRELSAPNCRLPNGAGEAEAGEAATGPDRPEAGMGDAAHAASATASGGGEGKGGVREGMMGLPPIGGAPISGTKQMAGGAGRKGGEALPLR